MNTAERLTEVVLPAPVEPAGLIVRERVASAPMPGHVTLRMEATGISFAEQQMRRGKYYDQPSFPFVPGYDLVGTAIAVGEGGNKSLLGQRFAAVTKTTAWASRVDVATTDILPVPADLDAAEVEALLVNGITAWQMLHDSARVPRGGTIVVLGANGGVGTILVQLAIHAGLGVIGTASRQHHDLLRSLGAQPVDYRDPDLYEQLHRLAPDGADAVFDHVGGPALVDSWRLVRRGGTLVSYGIASAKDADGGSQLPFLLAFARILAWKLLPNGTSASFYNLWSGRRRRERFVDRQRDALGHVLELLREGAVRPQIAARYPLSKAARALEFAESRAVAGKVVLVADE